MRFSRWLRRAFIFFIVLGVVFRFVNLNHKVYGHKEVYGTLQAAGYTLEEVERSLFQNQLIQAHDLQKYQQIKPGSTPDDTIRSLAISAPLQSPFYFLVARGWIEVFGEPLTHLFKGSLTTMRSLPALISLLALPAMYALAWELFASPAIALLATTLVALSPFDGLLAQTAQPYSLLTVMVIVSSWLLLRAIRLSVKSVPSQTSRPKPSSWLNWGLYGLSVAIGLYTQTFFALTLISHAGYVLACLIRPCDLNFSQKRILIGFGSSLAIAIITFSPWIVVIINNLQQVKTSIEEELFLDRWNDFLNQWFLSVTTSFFDVDSGLSNPLALILKLLFLALIAVSIYWVYGCSSKSVSRFIIFLSSIPFLLSPVLYVLWDGYRSTVNLYLTSSIPGVQLAVAYFFGKQWLQKGTHKRSTSLMHSSTGSSTQLKFFKFIRSYLRQGLLGVVAIASLTSLIMSASSFSWWDKDASYYNNQTAEIINVIPNAIVVSNIENRYTNTGDLLSLSYHLKKDTELLLIKVSEFVDTAEFRTLIQRKNAIVFRPSNRLQQILEQTYGKLSPVLAGERLWKISSSSVNNSVKEGGEKEGDGKFFANSTYTFSNNVTLA